MGSVTGKVRQPWTLEDIRTAQGEVRLHGMVHKIRDMGSFAFVMLRTSRYVLQCVLSQEQLNLLENLREGYSVRVTGTVHLDERAAYGFEIRLTGLTVLSRFAEASPVPLNKRRTNLSIDTSMEYRPAALRDPRVRAIFKVQEALSRAFSLFLTSQGFTEIHSPKIVAAGAEGGSTLFPLTYFDRKAYLAQSPQFYKQAMVPVFERVYEIGPVFRAERHNTSRHLNEYTSMDFEMGFLENFTDIMEMECGYLHFALNLLANEYAEELKLLGAKLPTIGDIPSIRFMDAKEMMAKKYGRKITTYSDLDPQEEALICRWAVEEKGSEFVFVTHYPTSSRPFYTMDDPEDPNCTLSFDLLFRGLEITSGGQRVHDYDEQVAKLERFHMNVADFESYLMTHKYGAPPHGGLGLGLERLTMQLLGLDNLRWAALFPRDMNRLVP